MTSHLSFRRGAMLAALCVMGISTASAQDRSVFRNLDLNGDGVITRAEWRGSDRSFRAYDLNEDGVITRREFLAVRDPAVAAYNPYNQDGRYDRDRYAQVSPGARAYQAGRERGLQDGRRAGFDDRNYGRWDLDGQRELQSADYGYRSDLGDHDIYQAGYREGFMIGYREAFGRGAPGQGRAYQLGRAQGLVDGRRAGREDADHARWDLEGQRELVVADAGYRDG